VDECQPLVVGVGATLAGDVQAGRRVLQGKAVQVDPIKPTLKPPGTKHSRLKCDELLSSFGFKFNLRRYIKGCSRYELLGKRGESSVFHVRYFEAGAYTRPLVSST